MKKKSQDKPFGFTLIEFVAVIIIAAILAVFAASRWSSTVNPNAGAQQLASDIRYTRGLAMTHGQRYLINITAPNSYSITTVTGSTAVPSSVTGKNTVTLSGVVFGSLTNLPNNLIAFDEEGVPYTDATATTPLSSTASIPITGGAITRVIQVSETTGRVIVQ